MHHQRKTITRIWPADPQEAEGGGGVMAPPPVGHEHSRTHHGSLVCGVAESRADNVAGGVRLEGSDHALPVRPPQNLQTMTTAGY